MRYDKVHLEAIGYELAPVVVTSDELEERLEPLYKKLHVPEGSLEALTGIAERRWWEPTHSLSKSAAAAAKKALAITGVPAEALETVVYAGVCRENFEPATACAVAVELGVQGAASVYDISNACLGILNGIHEIANRIELGQIRAGIVVSAETAREIVDVTIQRMLRDATMATYTEGLATLTGGSGAVAVLITDGSFDNDGTHRVLGGAQRAAPEHNDLCRWGLADAPTLHDAEPLLQWMYTDAASVLQHGVALANETWQDFLGQMAWEADQVDRVICHQVGTAHRDTILGSIGIDAKKDFSTFPYLGNVGTVSLPLTAALAEEREAITAGDRVAFLGIGSGLNCMMLGVEW
jgi:3-oxoacyl-[acyl-carrier-protein] synthase III